jgi:uncharacterized RDD family membrane protein YckC
MPRFDEIELEPGVAVDPAPPPELRAGAAPRIRRLLALLIDLSLFLALSPLLPRPSGWLHVASLAGFVVVLSYYYFVGAWLLWGKTIGGAIFDVRVIAASDSAMSLRNATLRWAAVYLSLLTAGLGFLLAALPSRQSLPDRMSATRCIAA